MAQALSQDARFDFIIVGGGTAGCILAERLTRSGRSKVLLVEAGGEARSPWIKVPAGFYKLLINKRYNWGFWSTEEAATESVVYNVSGEGRAISITYVDTGGILQMEFNVALPWSREVSLSPSTVKAASVTVINVGRDISCSITLNGTQTEQRSGNGLTICSSIGG